MQEEDKYSLKLRFWYHIQFPEQIVRHTLKHLPDGKSADFVSINVLEFVIVIINYCAALVAVLTENVTEDPYPVLLNVVDNTSAHSWTMHTCKGSFIAKLLAKFISYLMIGSRMGINSNWISTTDNYIADEISRLKKLLAGSSSSDS